MDSSKSTFAIIVGSMKSGTTNLYNLLTQHPEVSSCKVKEPEFFCKDNNYNKGIKSYLNLWEFDESVHKVAIEASTCYTKSPFFESAAKRISDSGINAKIIYIMRHPIDRIKSQIQMSRFKGWKYLNKDGTLHAKLISYSKYYLQISEYYKYFPSERILLLSFEELITHPMSTLIKVCEFIDIDPNFAFKPLIAKKHESIMYIYQNTFFLRTVFGIKSNEDYIAYLNSSKNKRKKLLLRQFFKWQLKNKNKLPKSQIQLIKMELSEDMGKLQNKLGFDTSIWRL